MSLQLKTAEFTAWVVQAMDGWPGDKSQKRQVIELLYDAYRQGRIAGMDSMVNPLRQCVENFDNMVAQSGKYNASARKAEDIQRFMKGVDNAKSNTGP